MDDVIGDHRLTQGTMDPFAVLGLLFGATDRHTQMAAAHHCKAVSPMNDGGAGLKVHVVQMAG